MSRLAPTDAPGAPGVRWDGAGLDVCVRSRHAGRIELCVFDETGTHELERHELPSRTGDAWHGRLRGGGPGLVYGLRAHGTYDPREGHRFNPHKLLVDPYARELVGTFRWNDAVLGWRPGHPDGCDSFDTRDSAPFVPKCRVARPLHAGAPRDDRLPRPARPWGETVVYELHVRGFSMLNPGVPAPLRGTVGGLAHPSSIAHLKRLGVTAVELLPVAAWLDELHLVRRGLTNYWGYNPLGFFAIQPSLAGPGGHAAMVEAVEALHAAGIEVILDVVFNHTAEGDERGPTLSLRGLDNASYYLPDPQRPGRYRNLSGCGNTLAAHDPMVSALIVDALRFWAVEIGVDGFRFDLASAIARDAGGAFDAGVPWIRALRDDPVLSRCKLVAEAWDCEGRFTGSFPTGWAEWNDAFRDDARRLWRGDAHGVGTLATRLAGSSDVFRSRGPAASVNFATAHDGFTLADWTAYRHRRNEANGEEGRDGAAENLSDDGGAEGPTDDAAVLRRRTRRARAMLATLMLSRGVPMLRAGDELGATQRGNNNAYCHDSPLTWLHWSPDGPSADAAGAAPPPSGRLLAEPDQRALIAELARLRAALPCLRGEGFLEGRRPPTRKDCPTWRGCVPTVRR
jgi:glycogen operon protein